MAHGPRLTSLHSYFKISRAQSHDSCQLQVSGSVHGAGVAGRRVSSLRPGRTQTVGPGGTQLGRCQVMWGAARGGFLLAGGRRGRGVGQGR